MLSQPNLDNFKVAQFNVTPDVIIKSVFYTIHEIKCQPLYCHMYQTITNINYRDFRINMNLIVFHTTRVNITQFELIGKTAFTSDLRNGIYRKRLLYMFL